MRRLFAIGEALIDFMPTVTNKALKDVEQFSRQVGGAPCNVACTVQKLGGHAEMITQLGNDAFGDIILETIRNIGVGTQYIERTDEANTALAFVSLKEDGQRDFSFYRKPSADMLYDANNIDNISINKEDVLHFCSVDLVESPMKKAHLAMVEKFEKQQGTIIFDPNVRLPLWDNEDDCREAILEFIPKAHILKVSDEEIEFITGEQNESVAINSLFKGNVEAVIYTQGSNGASIYLKDGTVNHQKGVTVKAIDTTGAGDAFIGAVISKILKEQENDITKLFKKHGDEILNFSNKVAAQVTTKYGAIESLPTLADLEE